MKLILENWKKFLNEDSKVAYGEPPPKFDPKTDALAVYIDQTDYNMYLVLYRPGISSQYNERVFGMMALSYTGNRVGPCIPKTFSVRLAAVDQAHQRFGIGKKLYTLAYTALTKEYGDDVGITSDHFHSTSKQAKGLWGDIDQLGFYKRSTDPGKGTFDELPPEERPGGNDTFDYTGKETPKDEKDDCKKPLGKPGTTHSWGRDADDPLYAQLVANAEANPPIVGDKGLRKMASALFDREYARRKT